MILFAQAAAHTDERGQEMHSKTTIIDVTEENLADFPQVICFINPKHEFYHFKIDWLKEQFKNGLKIKLLYLEGEKKPVGFIEYVPGEHCWRAVSAEGYMFIHCLWTNGKKHQHRGLGGLLLEEVEKDAQGKLGVAVVASDKAFMANREIFIKNGYIVTEESGEEQLLLKPFRDGPAPFINDWRAELKKYTGLTMVYSKQCPWVARFIEESKPILAREKLQCDIIELKNPSQAQKAPSLYGVFNLIYDGRLLADRYISTRRFNNILQKEF
jgi:hypothetical protein